MEILTLMIVKGTTTRDNDLGIKHAGFFLGDEQYGSYERFKRMYGAKQTQAIKEANNAMIIAQHINKQLMS